MACLASWWCPSSLQRPIAHFSFFSYNFHSGVGKKLRQQLGVTCSKNDQQQQQQDKCEKCSVSQEADGVGAKRRQILVGTTMTFAAAFSSFSPFVSDASADTDIPEGYRIYIDGENKYKILIPEGWRVGVGGGEASGFKSVTAFYPDQNASSNVSVIITGLGPDFTKMESFGKVDEFAETLVSGLDRSWQRPPGVAAKLLNSKSANGFYYIDYSLQKPGERRKYLYSALGMVSNGWYNRLYTVTGQFDEGDLDKYGSMIEKAVSSFRFI